MFVRKVHLPRHGHLPITGPVDWVRKYETPGLGCVLRRRLAWAAAALPAQPLRRVLEIGYGSGIFQYELGARAGLSVGIDIHSNGALVQRKLREDGVPAALVCGDGTQLPFCSASFDAVVILSALEFMPDPTACLRECRRVLAADGVFVCVTPRQLRWADTLLRWLTGSEPEADFRGGRARVQAATATVLPAATRQCRPSGLPSALAPYEVVVLRGAGQRGVGSGGGVGLGGGPAAAGA